MQLMDDPDPRVAGFDADRQMLPSDSHPLRSQLKQMVHQALID